MLAHRREIITQTSRQAARARHQPRHHPGRDFAASAGARAGRSDPDAASARHPERCDGVAAGRSGRSSTNATTRRPGPTRRSSPPIPNATLLGPDRNAMPRRRTRARRHLRDDDRVPAGRGADRAGLSGPHARTTRRSIPTCKGVHTVAGDYNEGQLAERMDRPKLIGDIVTHWHKYRRAAEDRGVRRQRRALDPSARRVRPIRRALPSTSTAQRQSPSAMQRWRAWHPARSSSSPIAWC